MEFLSEKPNFRNRARAGICENVENEVRAVYIANASTPLVSCGMQRPGEDGTRKRTNGMLGDRAISKPQTSGSIVLAPTGLSLS